MSYKIAIVGTRGVTSGFAAIGFEAFNVQSSEEATEVLFRLKKERQDETNPESPLKYAIVFVLEDYLKEVAEDDYAKLSKGALPAILPIPSHTGSTGFGETKIRRIVEKAVGSDIFG